MATRRPYELIEKVQTRQEFVVFVRALLTDHETNSDGWENATLDRFLDALASWTEDWFDTYGELEPSVQWKVFAQALLAASAYE